MSTNTITISKKEYKRLQSEARAYRAITSRVLDSVVHDTPDAVVADFRATELYTDEFLEDLSEGLKKSSYGNA